MSRLTDEGMSRVRRSMSADVTTISPRQLSSFAA
jgi:hypothetical protein